MNITTGQAMLQFSNGSLYSGSFTENFTAVTWTLVNRTFQPTLLVPTSLSSSVSAAVAPTVEMKTATTPHGPPPPPPPPPTPPPMRWRRKTENETGYLSIMSVASCAKTTWPDGKQHYNISNEDGYLTCDWKKQPPPQVGDFA
jgi:hypothetical protein